MAQALCQLLPLGVHVCCGRLHLQGDCLNKFVPPAVCGRPCASAGAEFEKLVALCQQSVVVLYVAKVERVCLGEDKVEESPSLFSRSVYKYCILRRYHHNWQQPNVTAEFGYALLIAPELLLIACRLAGISSIGKLDCQMDALALLLQHIVAYEPHALLSKGDSIVLRYVEEALCH